MGTFARLLNLVLDSLDKRAARKWHEKTIQKRDGTEIRRTLMVMVALKHYQPINVIIAGYLRAHRSEPTNTQSVLQCLIDDKLVQTNQQGWYALTSLGRQHASWLQ